MLAFYEAVIRGDINTVRTHLQEGFEPNNRICVYENGKLNHSPTANDLKGLRRTALQLAVLYRRISIAKLLVKYGALLERQALYNMVPDGTAFELAVKKDNLIFAGVLKDLGAIDSNEVLPKKFKFKAELDKAIRLDDVEAIDQLYEWNLVTTDIQLKILHKATRHHALNIVLFLLHSDNLDVDGQYGGRTALIEAVIGGFTDVVDLLLTAGANANYALIIKGHAITSLDFALVSDKQGSKMQIIELLLKFDADVNQINPNVLFNNLERLGVAEFELILQKGFKPMPVAGMSCVEFFLKNQRFDLATKLVQYGADISDLDNPDKNNLEIPSDGVFVQQLLMWGAQENRSVYMVGKSKEERAKSRLEYLVKQFPEPPVFGKPILFQLAEAAWKPGNLKKLKIFLNLAAHLTSNSNMGSTNINYCEPKNQWTALHGAFSSAKLLDISYGDDNPHKKAIDLLIQYGAEPKRNVMECTPLMNMQYAADPTYADILIDEYAGFEASYYQFEEKSYKQYLKEYYRDCSNIKNQQGFFVKGNLTRSQAIDKFWSSLNLTDPTNHPSV